MTTPAPSADGPGLLVVGELCVDVVVALGDHDVRFDQHEQIVPSATLTMGSSSAITACGAAALGLRTSLVGVRGDDALGDYVARELTLRGVAVDDVRIATGIATGMSVHLGRPSGDRAMLTAMGSIGETRATDVTDDRLAAHDHLHVGSYFLQRALWADAAALFERARGAGLTRSVDGNFDPDGTWDRGIRAVIERSDVFFASAAEIAGITGVADVDSAGDRLLATMSPGAVVVTKLGPSGAVAMWRDGDRAQRIHASPPPVAEPLVDTVGAGDSLAAGFLAARLRGAPVADALAFGVACGTASTRGAGGVAAQPDVATASDLARSVRMDSPDRA